ncbi:hypothetical protein MNBD_CHLOROFLEXI01-25, partial [hydrothermal vent metagenome]
TNGGVSSNPHWLRLVRSGNNITSYRSEDGQTWTLLDTMTVTMNQNIYIGMAVTANANSSLTSATFNNINVSTGGGSPTATPTNTLTPTATSPGPTATATPSPPPTATATNPPPTPTATPPPAEVVIQRVTFMLAGQAIAVKVSGDPTSDNNGIFYLFTDHLGSTVVLTKDSDGYILADSLTRYMPFGEYRGTAPSQTMTDKGYTGQKENMEIGLIYYNARFYVPGIGRFASADTIVPNPASPQSFNRYSYVRNNPLKYTDPTGYCAETGDDTCWTMYDRIVQICPECRTGAATPGTTLDQYGYDYQKYIFNRVSNGWRPSPATYPSLDYDRLASAAGNLELGLDTYSQFAIQLGGKGKGIPGPIGLSLVLIEAGMENRDESLTRIGYEMLTAGLIDAGVDAGAGIAAIKVGGAATAASGPVGGAIAGGVTFLGIELGYDQFISSHVDNAVDSFYMGIQRQWQALQVSSPNRYATPNPFSPATVPMAVPTPSSPSAVGTPIP